MKLSIILERKKMVIQKMNKLSRQDQLSGSIRNLKDLLDNEGLVTRKLKKLSDTRQQKVIILTQQLYSMLF